MGGVQKQYELNFVEILWLVAVGYNMRQAEDTGFDLMDEEMNKLLVEKQDLLIEAAQKIMPVPFP